LPPEHEFGHNIRGRYRRLSAAKVRGNSMIFRDIYDGDTILLQRSGFEYVENGRVVVIEKVSEEEGFGAWSLKRLVIVQPGSSTRNEFGDEIEGDNPNRSLDGPRAILPEISHLKSGRAERSDGRLAKIKTS
jgi:hypothetical protein